MNKEWKKKLTTYLLASYGLFWITFVILIALIATNIIKVNFGEQSFFLDGVKIFISWTPTMAVVLFHRILFPAKTLAEVFKGIFVEKLNVRLFFAVIVMEVAIYYIASLVTALFDHVSVMSQWSFSWDFFAYSFFLCLFTGATGEESGWHGFLFPHLMENMIV